MKPPTITDWLLHTKNEGSKLDIPWTPRCLQLYKTWTGNGCPKRENFSRSTLRCIRRHSPDFHDSKSMSSWSVPLPSSRRKLTLSAPSTSSPYNNKMDGFVMLLLGPHRSIQKGQSNALYESKQEKHHKSLGALACLVEVSQSNNQKTFRHVPNSQQKSSSSNDLTQDQHINNWTIDKFVWRLL